MFAGVDESGGSLADVSMADLKTRHSNVEDSNPVRNGDSSSSNGPGRATSPDPVISAHITSLRLLFTAWLSHFRSLGYIKETTMDTLDKTILRQTLQLSVRSPSARLALGSEPNIWSDLLSLLRVAIPSIESRSYATIPDPYDTGANPTGTVYDGPSANVVVENGTSLLRDLQRLNNILCIGRNILTAGVTVQNLAAQTAVDREVCCLINLCVKVTARGYDGDGTASEEERWQAVVNEYKKLLITCLQFVSNLVTLNERLKLMLWVELFDPASEGNVPPYPDPAGAVRPPQSGMEKSDRWVASKIDEIKDSLTSPTAPVVTERSNDTSGAASGSSYGEELDHEVMYAAKHSPERARSRTPISPRRMAKPIRPHMAYFTFLEAQKETVRRNMREELGKESPMVEVLAEATRVWERLPPEGKAPYNDQYNEALEQWKLEVDAWRAAGGSENTTSERDLSQRRAQEKLRHILGDVADANDGVEGARGRHGEENMFGTDLLCAISSVSPVQRAMESAEDGVRKLEEGKSELLKRLEHNSSIPAANPNAVSPASPVTSPISPLEDTPNNLPLELEEHSEEEGAEEDELDEQVDICSDDGEEEEDEESCSDDYDRIPGEDGRGLLTDIPLILGPNEIEVLPMIVMSGIVCDQAQIAQRKTEIAEANFEVNAHDRIANTSAQDSAPVQKKTPDESLQTLLNMYTIRCHLLLAQENGRNLLRELLIFVAAWDLREEELYFKFMVKIMESILLHGLMPFAYNAFKESKDVISPAQAVIMKLLTKIFHARAAFAGGVYSGSTKGADERVGRAAAAATDFPEHQNSYYIPPNWPKNRDGSLATSGISYTHPVTGQVHLDPTRAIVASLIAEFRGSIIPQICALIFLQGQIRQGKASLDDFPLNLWDMERMYEGVYQYLEFFAILTDCEEWKDLLAGWEVISELVTLLRELEVGIGKGRMGSRTPRQYTDHREQSTHVANLSPQMGSMQPSAARGTSQHHEAHQDGLTPVAVEMPYCAEVAPKTTSFATRNTHAAPLKLPLPTPPSAPPDGIANPPTQPLPLIPDGVSGTVPCLPSIPSAPLPPHEEPALFEWRNLKKLCVLVLSSLVWKNRILQDQMLRFGGVEAVLRCCQQGHEPGDEAGTARPHGTGLSVDEHNPYIREHAIMCLRFCCEGNLEVQEFIKNIVKNSERVEKLAKNAETREGASFDQTDAAYGFERENILKVPPEVLDAHGYETFMDQKGQVGLRRKKSRARGGATAGSTAPTAQHSASAFASTPNKGGPGTAHHPHHHHHSGQPNLPHHHHHHHQPQPKQYQAPRPLPRPATPPPRGPRAIDIYDSEDESWVEEAERWRTGLAAVGGDRDAVPLSLRPGYERGYVHVEGARVQDGGAGWSAGAAASGSPMTVGQAGALQQGQDQIQTTTHARAQESEDDLVEEKPRTAADLPAWVERITRDLPHRRLERDRAMAAAAGREEEPSPQSD